MCPTRSDALVTVSDIVYRTEYWSLRQDAGDTQDAHGAQDTGHASGRACTDSGQKCKVPVEGWVTLKVG